MKFLLVLVALPVLASSYIKKTCNKAYSEGTPTNKIEMTEGQNKQFVYGKDRNEGYFFDVVENDTLKERILTEYLPLDTKENDGYIYTLFANQIIVRDALTLNVVMKIKTTKNSITNKHQAASELHIVDNNIYVAHGSLHLVVIDKKSGSIINNTKYDVQKKPSHVSRMTGIEVYNGTIYMMFDNVTYDFSDQTRAFEGMLNVDLKTLKPTKQIWINQRVEALHEPSLQRDGENLYSQNLHLVFNYKVKNLNRLRTLRPNRRLYNFDNFKLLGSPIISQGKIKGCYTKRYTEPDPVTSLYYEFQL